MQTEIKTRSSIDTNYLVITFDGFGDGILYYPIFREIGERLPQLLFFYTSNTFFSNSGIQKNIKIPPNFRPINDVFRKFPKNHWNEISVFIQENNIKTVINLRIIGRRFEKDYYDFKNWLHILDNEISFYDDETLKGNERTDTNIRNIILSLCQKAVKEKFSYNTSILKFSFPLKKGGNDIIINMHSRGTFKLWEPKKWTELISSLVLFNRKIKIYGGVNKQEKSYTRRVIKDLSPSVLAKVKILRPTNLYDTGKSLQNTFLLISVDSGLIHLADILGVNSLGIYITTSPVTWGGVTDKFRCISSSHMLGCKNFYAYFGMCMNNKQKCEEISNGKDDVLVSDVLGKINQIFYEQKN